MYTFEEIVGIIRQRQDHQSPLMDRMLEIKERYNGDYVIPLPSMEEEPILPPLTPALISENIDAVAQRAASVTPFIGCPAVDPTKERGRRSRQYADIRKRALAATWYQNRLKVKMRRAYRHLAGYATTALVVATAASCVVEEESRREAGAAPAAVALNGGCTRPRQSQSLLQLWLEQ